MKLKRKAISKSVRFGILSRDNFTCRYCGRKSDIVALHVDHVIPVCKGGTNDDENLVTSCSDCNLGKAGKKLSEIVLIESLKTQMNHDRAKQISPIEIGSVELDFSNQQRVSATQINRAVDILLSFINQHEPGSALERIIQSDDRPARYKVFDRFGRRVSGHSPECLKDIV